MQPAFTTGKYAWNRRLFVTGTTDDHGFVNIYNVDASYASYAFEKEFQLVIRQGTADSFDS